MSNIRFVQNFSFLNQTITKLRVAQNMKKFVEILTTLGSRNKQ